MLRGRRLYRIAASMAVGALVLAACGADEEPADTDDGEVEDVDDDADADADADADDDDDAQADGSGDGQYGGTLRMAFPQDLVTLDQMAVTTEPSSPRHAVYEQLVALDANLVPQPALATDWETSDDGLTWTFNLREGVQFHNGEEMTADDVVASWNRFEEMGARAFELDRVESVEAVDDLTVDVNLSSPYGAILESIAAMTGGWAIMPADVADSLGADQASAVEDIVGTGPYMAEEIVPEVSTTLVRFDDYTIHEELEPSYNAGPRHAYFDEVIIETMEEDSTRVSALLAGEVDLIHYVPGDEAERLRDDDDTEVVPTRPGNRVYYKFNVDGGIFEDPELRDALRTGIDSEELMLGHGPEEFWRVNNTPRYQEPQWPWVDQSHHFPNDMEAAQQMVEDSDYDGEEITFLVSPGRADEYPTVTPFEQQMQEMGFNVTIQSVDSATFSEVRQDLDAWDIKHSGGGSMVGLSYLDASGVNRNGDPWPNMPDEWYDLLDEAVNLEDQDERAAVAEEIYELHAEINNEMWIGDVFLIASGRSDIRNIPDDDFTLAFWNIWRDE